jgi:hypothetical protein
MIPLPVLILPAPWREINPPFYGQRAYQRPGIAVIVTEEEYEGNKWLHVSMSRRERLPLWSELREVKDIFIGRDKKAIQVLPPEKEYVNIHPYCLHLWHCMTKEVLPDFTQGTGMI